MFSVRTTHYKDVKFIVILIILLHGFPNSNSGNDNLCHFVNYKAKCSTSITKVPINVVIYFNVCHKPIDVTFTFTDTNNTINWKHTFVTTNLAETKSFDGFEKDVELHVVLLKNGQQLITVKADLHIGGSKGLFIVDDSIYITDKTICNQSNNALVYQLVIIFSALLIFAISATVILIYFHQKNKSLDNAYLTDNENPGRISGPAPYQEGPNDQNYSSILNFLKNKFRRDLSVHYMRTGDNNAMCIIENEYVQHPDPAS